MLCRLNFSEMCASYRNPKNHHYHAYVSENIKSCIKNCLDGGCNGKHQQVTVRRWKLGCEHNNLIDTKP